VPNNPPHFEQSHFPPGPVPLGVGVAEITPLLPQYIGLISDIPSQYTPQAEAQSFRTQRGEPAASCPGAREVADAIKFLYVHDGPPTVPQ